MFKKKFNDFLRCLLIISAKDVLVFSIKSYSGSVFLLNMRAGHE